jgi:predicted PolB exonuclease-like 3'-5' exonuclease
VRRFFDGIERLAPTLVSWNGSGFDLPVLHYRALRHKVQAHRYWEMGEFDQSYKWNNYISRFHWRHIDLMDVLSGFQGRGRVGLDKMAQLLGFPGKLGMSGEGVWDAHLEGRTVDIRNYCETDVINTFLIYLRFELMRGRLSHEEYEREEDLVRAGLVAAQKPHLQEYADAWSRSAT